MRYIILILLNLPIIVLAFLNIITKYKLGRLQKSRLFKQLLLWLSVLTIILCAFPAYNTIMGRHILDSRDLSSFDIVQTTVIVMLIYTVNNLRQKTESVERRIRDLHQELSLIISREKNEKS